MSMSQIVSFLNLWVYPSVAMIFFLGAFVAVVWRVMTRPRQELIDASRIVLDDDRVVTPRYPSLRDPTPTTPTAPTPPADEKGTDHA